MVSRSRRLTVDGNASISFSAHDRISTWYISDPHLSLFLEELVQRACRFIRDAGFKDTQTVFQIFQTLDERIVGINTEQNGAHTLIRGNK